ncbi:hypothetical protein JL722_9929 [Aureococcus anophagefferens]|nr:hypothetical protein JL722_9929 [Aureococcus anophagefferens]
MQLAHMLEGKQISLEASEKFARAWLAQVTCPISLRLCVRPVVAADGRVFERDAIERWLSSKSTSPLTNQEMGSRLVDCASTRSLILEAIEDGVIENDAAVAWHIESAKAKAAGKLPGDLSSVNEHLIRARKILVATDGDILAYAEEISLMLQALDLRLRVDTLKKAAAEAGTDGVATILQLPNHARMTELELENARLRQTIRFLERGRGSARTAAVAPEARIVVDVEFPPEFGARGAALERNEATWRGRLDTAEAEIASLRRQLDAERASDERISTLEEENRTLKEELKKTKSKLKLAQRVFRDDVHDAVTAASYGATPREPRRAAAKVTGPRDGERSRERTPLAPAPRAKTSSKRARARGGGDDGQRPAAAAPTPGSDKRRATPGGSATSSRASDDDDDERAAPARPPAPAAAKRRRREARRRAKPAAPAARRPAPAARQPEAAAKPPAPRRGPPPVAAPAPAARPPLTQPGAFAYQEVVRKKCDRAKLPGHFCAQCQPFIDATKDGLRPEDVAALQAECSRHRAYQPPQGTPDDRGHAIDARVADAVSCKVCTLRDRSNATLNNATALAALESPTSACSRGRRAPTTRTTSTPSGGRASATKTSPSSRPSGSSRWADNATDVADAAHRVLVNFLGLRSWSPEALEGRDSSPTAARLARAQGGRRAADDDARWACGDGDLADLAAFYAPLNGRVAGDVARAVATYAMIWDRKFLLARLPGWLTPNPPRRAHYARLQRRLESDGPWV